MLKETKHITTLIILLALYLLTACKYEASTEQLQFEQQVKNYNWYSELYPVEFNSDRFVCQNIMKFDTVNKKIETKVQLWKNRYDYNDYYQKDYYQKDNYIIFEEMYFYNKVNKIDFGLAFIKAKEYTKLGELIQIEENNKKPIPIEHVDYKFSRIDSSGFGELIWNGIRYNNNESLNNTENEVLFL